MQMLQYSRKENLKKRTLEYVSTVGDYHKNYPKPLNSEEKDIIEDKYMLFRRLSKQKHYL